LDLSHCPNLQSLFCPNNQLPQLDLSHCPNLQRLFCNNNQLPQLDLSHCPHLKILNCANNKLEELNILNNDKLIYSDWKDNPIFNNETNTIEKMKEYNRNNYCSEYILK
jgi:Leucine-rich repeat (LRR) protein